MDAQAAKEAENAERELLVPTADERAISSSGSSLGTEEEATRPETSKGRKKQRPRNLENVHARTVSQLPELGPPLSPIQI